VNQELRNIPLAAIRPDPDNPRKGFDQELLQGLAASIAANGLEQPITVRPDGDGYILIAGERRYRAHQLIGAATITAIVRTGISADEAATRQVIENLQRADLNPIDEARGFQRLMEKRGWNQSDLAKQLGINRTKVAKALGLLKRPPEVQQALAEGRITPRHADAIGILSDDEQTAAVAEITDQGLTVAATRQRFRQAGNPDCAPAHTPSADGGLGQAGNPGCAPVHITATPRHPTTCLLVKTLIQLREVAPRLVGSDPEVIRQAANELADIAELLG